jgi:hypothetical protein
MSKAGNDLSTLILVKEKRIMIALKQKLNHFLVESHQGKFLMEKCVFCSPLCVRRGLPLRRWETQTGSRFDMRGWRESPRVFPKNAPCVLYFQPCGHH